MTDVLRDADSVDIAAGLLSHYSFDRAGQTVGQLVATWLQQYPAAWLRAATIEALYQGRYKAVSVSQILSIWERRGQPLCHFNWEFERIVCSPVIGDRAFSSVSDELHAIASSGSLDPGHHNGNGHSIPLTERLPCIASPDGDDPEAYELGDRPASEHPAIPPFRPAELPPAADPPPAIPSSTHTAAPGEDVQHHPIHQFAPEQDEQGESAFYQRLQAIALSEQSRISRLRQPSLDRPTQVEAPHSMPEAQLAPQPDTTQ